MRTQGNFVADTPFSGSFIFYDAIELLDISASTLAALTRNALGDYSLNRTAGGAETHRVITNLSSMNRRLTTYPGLSGMPFQEQFGTAAGTVGYPAGAAGLPPFAGANELVQPTTNPAKGIRITDVVAIYQVGVADLTSASLSLNTTVFANNVANAITNIPVSAIALPLTAAGDATGPYVAVRAVTTPAFHVADLSDVSLEFSVVMANTGTIRFYGLGFHFDYNFS